MLPKLSIVILLLSAVTTPLHAQTQPKASSAPAQASTRNVKSAKEAYQRGRQAEKEQNWPRAFAAYTVATRQDPTNREYLLRREVARSRLVADAVNRAERAALIGHLAEAREELHSALLLDPSDEMVRERLGQLAMPSAAKLRELLAEPKGVIWLEPLTGTRNFDYRGDLQGAYEEVARQFGVDASFDVNLPSKPVRLRIDNVDFPTAMRVLGDMTGTFWRPLTQRLFFVAADTPEKRRAYDLSVVRSVQLPASETPDDMTQMLRLVRTIAGITRAELNAPSRTITLRASPQAIAVAGKLIDQLEQPRGEIVLDMEVLEVNRNAARQLGITPPETASAFTLSPQQLQEAQQSVQGLIAVIQQLFGSTSSLSGLSASQIASLVGSGQLGIGSLIPPLVAFGGGKTTFLATLPGAAVALSDTLNLVRSGRRILLRAEDNKPATFFVGDRVPITLGIFSPSITQAQFIPGVTSNLFPRTDFATGRDPVAVTARDFNGDGANDLAVANRADNTLTILLNNGSGNFSAAAGSPPATGNLPDAVVSGSFAANNAVDHTDLAVANFNCTGLPLTCGPGTVSILLGNGDGTFQPKLDTPAGHGPVALATGKFNSKSATDLTDLAVVNQVDNTVSILLGNGDGTFSPASTISTGRSPSAIAVGDFNNDGIPDLAVTNQADNTVSIFLGNGDGTFTPKGTLATGNGPDAILAGTFDTNSNNNIDLAVANRTDNTVSIFIGNNAGTFTAGGAFSTGTGPVAMATADFNLDGRPDLAVSDQNANTVSILIGNGDGTFAPRLDLPTGTGPAGLAAADFNGDSRTDLAVTDSTANTVTVILNNATFISPQGRGVALTPFPNAEYEDVGLKIKATPHLHGNGEVTLDLHFELRSLTGDSVNGIPVISNQSVDQTVSVKDDETTALAGILESQDMRIISGTPGLAALGAAGLLASRHNTQQSDTELLILVTPRIVRLGPVAGKPIYAGRAPVEGGAGFVNPPFPGRPVP